MSFDAIRLIESAQLEIPLISLQPEGPLIVKINGNEGYTCDSEGTVDQHTAHLLCQKAGYGGASNWWTEGRPSEKDIRLIIKLF